jgi:hypothetical protein
MPFTFPNVWIYRLGIAGSDQNSKRWMVSQTWATSTPPASSGPPVTIFRSVAQSMRRPFGNVAGLKYDGYNAWSEEIYPKRRLIEAPSLFPSSLRESLNVQAEEASFRLQRVGLSVSGSKGIGRVCFPILTDTYYTDVPKRRHVDVATLAPLLASSTFGNLFTFTAFGITYTNVVFSRWSMELTPVDHFELQENPVRIWQRWRTYNYAGRHVADETWKGPQLLI